MHSLARPFLFAIARLGLFLAIVAAIVGQKWRVTANTHMGAGAALATEGWAITIWERRSGVSRYSVEPAARAYPLDGFFRYPHYSFTRYGPRFGFTLAGFTFGVFRNAAIMGIHHALLIALFGMFYFVLRRKTPHGSDAASVTDA